MAFAVIPAARHPLDPCGLTSRGCKIRVMLRAGQSLPPTGLSTLRFDAGRFPPTPAACYWASWQLPQTGLPPAGEHGLTRGSLLPSTSSHYTVPHAAGHKESRLGAPAEAVDGMRRPDLPEGSPGGRADPNVARHGRRTSSAPSRPGGHGRGAS